MAPLQKGTEQAAAKKKRSKKELLWREAWQGSPYTGVVALSEDRLVIQCEKVTAEYCADAEILDDGRTVGIGIGDRVAFAVVSEGDDGTPIAVNVYRASKSSKKKSAAFDFSTWADDAEQETPKGKGKNNRPVQLSKALAGELVGVIRNQSFTSGNYFVECEEVYEQFQADVMIRPHEMPRAVGIGDAVVFKIKPPRPDSYTCSVIPGVRKAPDELAQAVLERGFRDGRRCFNCGGLHLARDCPEGGKKGGGKRKGISGQRGVKLDSMRMVGIVKKKTPTGAHWILCQDISDVYGVDAQIPVEEIPDDLKIGDRISFDVDEPPVGHRGTPLARNVRRLAAGLPGAAKQIPVEMGDGEDDEGDGLDEADDGEADEDTAAVNEADVDGVDEDVEVEVDGDEEEEMQEEAAPAKKSADAEAKGAPHAKRRKVEEVSIEEEPDSIAGWKEAQDRLFGHLPPLLKGWIRVKSKSKGLVYYYNTITGESTSTEPRK